MNKNAKVILRLHKASQISLPSYLRFDHNRLWPGSARSVKWIAKWMHKGGLISSIINAPEPTYIQKEILNRKEINLY